MMILEGVSFLAGQIKMLIDKLVQEKSKGNPVIANTVRTKLILKGITVSKYTNVSPDDPAVIKQVKAAALELGVKL